jgi:hypothetical protein
MASTITLLKNFAGGQGAGFSNYYAYAADHDANYIKIENVCNQLVGELMGVQGPNAALVTQILGTNWAAGPAGVTQDGVVGEHSYKVSIGAPTTELDVTGGIAIVNTQKVEMTVGLSITGPGGGAMDHYLALDANGIPSIEVAAAQKSLDIARVAWSGAAYTGTVWQEAEIFLDGDEVAALHRRAPAGDAGTPTFPRLDGTTSTNFFRLIASRIRDLENILAGVKTGEEGGTTLGAVVFGGTPGAVGLALSNGTLYELDSGFYRAAADQPAVAIAGSQLLRFVASQILANADGLPATPFYGWGTDPGMGMYRIAGDRLGFATGTALGLELSDYQQPTSPTAFRFRATTAAEALASGTALVPISMDAEVTDVGGWGSVPGTDWTVPTGGDGFYLLAGSILFDESTSATPNVGTLRRSAIQVAGSAVVEEQDEENQNVNIDAAQSLVAAVQLTAGQVVRLAAAQDSGNSMNVDGSISGVRLW